ncbi:hypothetical protein SH601_06800 [Gracilibacillus sp. S3-1-1]|uniref:Uncharacterized protein n=1 Tax=Gracilibacillus pellucidus TaxID=3095368 RepID=A0ACC6M475_9BACI|nr:hypothetical protein [Gracilibacillus sp. S3-1-1]MDX8045695.1 hypothetical protein [Gracilibacillus sp. S3-1-1]
MAKPSNKEKDARINYELDVDRMINEGMAGGTTASNKERMQIEQARALPKDDEAFPTENEE